MKKLLAFSLAIFLFLQLFLTVSPTEVLAAPADEVLTLHAQSAVLMDGDTGRILYAKNAGEVRPMASTTKIMTLILALENGNPDDLVTVSAYAASMPDVQLHIRAGEKYRLGDLLYSMMLESHNDAAVAIAEHVGGTVPGFAALMNAKARDIGCYSTHYVTPNGLDAEDGNGVHSTTAADLARVMRYCITLSPRREEFLKITRTDSYSFGDTEGLRSFTVGNKNAFLHMMEGALSGKTGFTGNAGYCYVGALRQEERTLIVALLACGWPNNRSYKWSDTRKLMNYGLEHFTYRNVWQEPKLPELPVKNGIPDSGNLEEEVRIRLRLSSEEPDLKFLLSEDEQVQVETHISQEVTAPVEPGTLLGSVRYLLDGQVVKVYTVEAAEDVEAVTLGWCLEKLWRKYIL
ncbi:D-alanyl-D-alanine carboxypeptidase [Anaerosacchariphilus sp. NSJ-68]|uniref:serine-type D-Ala-D-Ala carboxypeptidase n=2 Tax=Lachnospiraceae TaxID=186803 RepID=A0A923LC69_9FIRM|nr:MULTISPECIES: D-alanyl-D-alanine carboxypeptidase family protein [Lachnospiraceae]MBC5659592.1 D-alanyl-D-alanine carboxypeptidase [Anaerosacchariphilus hominis]MBC5697259.1 D-alanyl-D-alanine carboxypeptidase [Roseburia difficilis]